jgi:flagellar motor switch protein FliM
MQPAFRAIRSVRYGGALKTPSAARGIHSTAVNPNPAVFVTESRHSTEVRTCYVSIFTYEELDMSPRNLTLLANFCGFCGAALLTQP